MPPLAFPYVAPMSYIVDLRTRGESEHKGAAYHIMTFTNTVFKALEIHDDFAKSGLK